jgi:hypothetical protein
LSIYIELFNRLCGSRETSIFCKVSILSDSDQRLVVSSIGPRHAFDNAMPKRAKLGKRNRNKDARAVGTGSLPRF